MRTHYMWLSGCVGVLSLVLCYPFAIVRLLCLGIFGFVGMIVWAKHQNRISNMPNFCQRPLPTGNGLFKFDLESEQRNAEQNCKYELSGLKLTDAALHRFIDILESVYISTWYNRFSTNQQVPRKIRHILCFMVKKVARNLQKIDFQKLVFEDGGECLSHHCKLWKSALTKEEVSFQSDDISIQSVFSIKSTESEKHSEKTVVDYFFEEEEAETGLSLENVSTNPNREYNLVQTVAESLLYLLLPEEELKSRVVVKLLVEIVTNGILMPLVETLSNPDYLNQMICWWLEELSDDIEEVSANLLVTIKECNSLSELEALKVLLDCECNHLRANDTAGSESPERQELIFLEELLKLANDKIKKIGKGESMASSNESCAKGDNLYDLDIRIVLSNRTALEAFKNYLKEEVAQEKYLFFWLQVENFRNSAEKLNSDLTNRNQSNTTSRISEFLKMSKNTSHFQISTLRNIACCIYEEYLSPSAPARLELDEALVGQLKHELSVEEELNAKLFDSLQHRCFNQLTTDSLLYPGFRLSRYYVEMLGKLDLIDMEHKIDSVQLDDVVQLSAQITDTNVANEFGSQYALYQITVTKMNGAEDSRTYCTYRRYSDFHDMDIRIRELLGQDDYKVSSLTLPSKTLFRDLKNEFLSTRAELLNEYISTFSKIAHGRRFIFPLLEEFLSQEPYTNKKKAIQKRVDSLVTPFKTASRNAAQVMVDAPGHFLASLKNQAEQVKQKIVPSGTPSPSSAKEDVEEKWLLSFRNALDEIFNLYARGKWFRRQFLQLCTTIFQNAFFAGKVNLKMKEYIGEFTADAEVATYIDKIKDSLFPKDRPAASRPKRTQQDIVLTGLLCRIRMLTAFPENLRHMLGNETTRLGIYRFWAMIQEPQLNRRFVWVLIELILSTIFPKNTFYKVFDAYKKPS